MRRALPLLLCTFLCVVSVRPSWAQFESGSVVGTVRDTTGGVVAEASVTLLSPDTGVEVKRTTGGDGTYEFVTVRPGIYVVSAEKTGLAIALVDNVQVQVGAACASISQMSRSAPCRNASRSPARRRWSKPTAASAAR